MSGASSPPTSLSDEVVGKIFLFACDSFEREHYKTPFILGLVCKRWRTIAHRNPALWTHIYFGPCGSRLSPALLEHYMTMSADLPLSVKIINAFSDFQQMPDAELGCLAVLCSRAARWKVAQIHMHNFDNFERLLESGETLAQLESLTLEWPLVKREAGHTPPDIFLRAPRLSSLTLLAGESKLQPDTDVWTPGLLPWGQIQEVTTDLNDLDTLHHIPEAGREMTLVIRSPVPEYRHTRSGFSLGLSSLVLEPGTWSAGLSSFLDYVSIPTLRDLRLVCPDANEAASHTARHDSQSLQVIWRNALDASVRMVVRSGCVLRSFDFSLGGLYHGDLDDSSLAHGLVALMRVCHPRLEILRIVEGCGPALLEDELFMFPFENLRSLELVWVRDQMPAKSLIKMLDSSIGRSNLASVVLGVRGPVYAKVGADVSECMQRLREGGIESWLW